jgi:hypothetical protein
MALRPTMFWFAFLHAFVLYVADIYIGWTPLFWFLNGIWILLVVQHNQKGLNSFVSTNDGVLIFNFLIFNIFF